MLRLWRVLLASATLAGCAHELPFERPQPNMVWLRVDGQRGAGNPALAQQFEADQTACFGGAPSDNERTQPADAAVKDCMAKRGYIQVAENQAEAKSQELAAANGQRPLPASLSR